MFVDGRGVSFCHCFSIQKQFLNFLIINWLPQGQLSLFPGYWVNDACRSPLHSPRFRVCSEASRADSNEFWCDDYSVGSGYCPVYPPQNIEVVLANESKLKLPSRTDHCMAMARLANQSHMWLDDGLVASNFKPCRVIIEEFHPISGEICGTTMYYGASF